MGGFFVSRNCAFEGTPAKIRVTNAHLLRRRGDTAKRGPAAQIALSVP